MDHAPDSSPGIARPATAGASPATTATWDQYYKEARRRRRAAGNSRSLRDQKRRRRIRERLRFGIFALLMVGMMAMFYFVLS